MELGLANRKRQKRVYATAVLFFGPMTAKKAPMSAKKAKAKKQAASKPSKAVIGTTAKKPAKAAKVARAVGPGADPKRVAAILAKLDEAYPTATCELIHESPFQLLISTILSAQTTDVRVNEVTRTLYKKYPNPEALVYANPRELEQDIRPTGFFRNKTKSIMGASKGIIENFGGQVPRTMEEILTLPGGESLSVYLVA